MTAQLDHDAAPEAEEFRRQLAQRGRADLARAEALQAQHASKPRAEVQDLEAMLERFAYWSDKDQVIDLANPWRVFTVQGFKHFTAASSRLLVGPRGGETHVPIARDWLEHEARVQVEGFAFEPGRPRITADVNGRPAVNLWNAPGIASRALPSDWEQRAAIFDAHLAYLIPDADERDHVVRWLAHRVQRSGELPGWHLLLVANNVQGTGRNWLARMLKAMLGRYVIEGLDLRRVLDGGFNAELEQAIVAVVDEIREGGQEHWRHAEYLKSFLTEKTRTINQKYLATYEVRNCLGVMLFSNHLDALPLDETDRRLYVARCTQEPREGSYFDSIYTALENLDTLRALYERLMTVELDGFPIAGRAPDSATKLDVIEHGRTDEEAELRRLIREWPSDVMRSSTLRNMLQDVRYDGSDFNERPEDRPKDAALPTSTLRRLYRVCGVVTWKQQVRIDQELTRVVVLRNYFAAWKHAEDRALGAEVLRGEQEQANREAARREAARREAARRSLDATGAAA